MLRLEKCQKMPQNPTRQVHALLGMGLEDTISLHSVLCHLPAFFVLRSDLTVPTLFESDLSATTL